jgi:hypothetical protein
MEKLLIRRIVYPALQLDTVSPAFTDQYAFRPTGSTTAALTAILDDLSEMSQIYPYVQIVALDFSKAFDTVRHCTLLDKIRKLPLPDFFYSWIIAYFTGIQHCTKSSGKVSTPQPINASVVQGSALGPIAFIINATDLKAITPGNKLHKYADDTYLLVPSDNCNTIPSELTNISQWAEINNLNLNTKKSQIMIVSKHPPTYYTSPPTIPDVAKVTSLNILGVTIQNNLSMRDHVSGIVSNCAQNLYALKVLKAHGMPLASLNNVCCATLVAKLTYAASSWVGFTTSADRLRLQAVLNKASRWGVCKTNAFNFQAIVDNADKTLFNSVVNNEAHVLHKMLPPVKGHTHSLRPRPHNRTIPINTAPSSRNFIYRMLFKDIY